MLHKLSFSLLFAVLTSGQIASAQVFQPGKCPEVKFLKDFDWSSFKGVWYLYAKYKIDSAVGLDCAYFTLTSINKDTFDFKVSGTDQHNVSASSDGTLKTLNGSGRFIISFKDRNTTQTNEILDADNKSWAVMYNCEVYLFGHVQTVWILTRKRSPDADTVNKAEAVLKRKGLSLQFLKTVSQNGCPAH